MGLPAGLASHAAHALGFALAELFEPVVFCVTNFAPLLVFRWFNQPVAHLPPRMATPGAAAASCGQEALICLVRLGLFEYVRPTRRNLASRVGCWAKVSRALRLAVRARHAADWAWEPTASRWLRRQRASEEASPEPEPSASPEPEPEPSASPRRRRRGRRYSLWRRS